MRLINTTTLELREFFDTQCPKYAVLSHTWEDQEVSYLDFLFLTSTPHKDVMGAIQTLLKTPKPDSAGFKKIKSWCELARAREYEWVWIDTCCIDKNSSAELQEAINSMYRWYQDAAECFVYLADITAKPNTVETDLDTAQQNESDFYEQLGRARWFTRGWTLQELLAPKRVIFCNKWWQIVASKSSISARLSEITKIPREYLDGRFEARDGAICSVAMRMSWVSRRETTRIEDMAYCMLGLFDVNMPLIYGEGRKAFMRLQLEILKKADDDSIYAWTAPMDRSGLLASWPTAFQNSGRVCQVSFPHDEVVWVPPVMTSIGLKFMTRYHREDDQQDKVDAKHGVHSIQEARSLQPNAAVVLHCGVVNETSNRPLVTQVWPPNVSGQAIIIFLRRFGATWQRTHCNELLSSYYGNAGLPGSSGSEAYIVYYIPQEGL